MLYMQIYIPCKELQMLKKLYFPARYKESMSAKIYISSNVQKIYFLRYMESKDPTVFTKTYEEGVERVLKVVKLTMKMVIVMTLITLQRTFILVNYSFQLFLSSFRVILPSCVNQQC